VSKTLEQKFSELLVEVRQRAEHYNNRRMETEKRCREMVDEAVTATAAIRENQKEILSMLDSHIKALHRTNDKLNRLDTLFELRERLDRMEKSVDVHSTTAEHIEESLRKGVRHLYETTIAHSDSVQETPVEWSVHHLELSQRPLNALLSDGIETIEQLCQHTEMELMKIPNFGKGSLREVIFVLHQNGLKLGMVTE